MQTAGKAPSVRIMENRIAELEAEIEQLREELEFADGKYLACYNAKCEVDRKVTQAAAFLDRMADRIWPDCPEAADECRAMARKLLGDPGGARLPRAG